MIRLANPEVITIDCNEIQKLATDADRRTYALEKAFFINNVRLGNIELRITFRSENRPQQLFIYFFQQMVKSQVEPFYIADTSVETIIINPVESSFWRQNPLYVDKIGILAQGNGTCELLVEVFKVF